jgi:riboflavin synthase
VSDIRMFTGIIERLAEVRRVAAGEVCRLEIDLGLLAAGLKRGDSVNVNGTCLTVAETGRGVVGFDVIPETLRRSNLGDLSPGAKVNVERSLQVGARLDGHFVQGHVDGQARLERIDEAGSEYVMWLSTDPELMPYIVPKGSIALDGVSLTVADIEGGRFSVALIPTTLRDTTLGLRRPGDTLNLETDILVRAVAHLLETGRVQASRGVTWEMLREHGFVEETAPRGGAS